jgi:hypothetical protein
MLDKLFQAAIITFLLYLIVGLNSATTSQTKAASTTPTTPTSITRLLLSSR